MEYNDNDDYPSHSLKNSFISTLDHLPCDIVRSLWLIQSCNLKIDKSKQEINTLLKQYHDRMTIDDISLKRIYLLKERIGYLSNEAIEETKAMNNQLITHRLNLLQEMDQLKRIEMNKHNQVDETERNELRQQLKEHYKVNPLASQVEAVQEQKDLKSGENSQPPKLVIKLPKQDKVVKPKNQKIVKKVTKKPEEKKPKKKEAKKEVPVVELETEEEEEEEEKDEDNNLYCFCHQKSFGNMISCDNEDSCPNGEWFHYKCVGLLNRVDALKFTTGKMAWYCSEECRRIGETKQSISDDKKRRKRKRRW
ncbi:hypothetical protein G210_5128 [Candida maltosa Xu316]|uniref:Zinc finger PHD-type domain-containing protein n=1 Tax=Candida maltosa (strain Xu316) TaxID=1245528 RepID=M3K3R3_CANMX|nr:hypothetical protein G210_5128 [Candida maltosa Xu316]